LAGFVLSRARSGSVLATQFATADWLARPVNTNAALALIALLRWVGVNPRTFDAFVLLCGFVRLLPVALAKYRKLF
jgi:hypothetical protein